MVKKRKKEKKSENTKKPEKTTSEAKEKKSPDDDYFESEEFQKELEEARAKIEQELEETSEDLGDYTLKEKEVPEEVEEESLEYNNLTDEEERIKIKKNMAKTHVYLEKLGIQEMRVDSKKNIIIVPFEYEQFQFLSHIIVGAEWFIVKASIMELETVPKHAVSQMFFELLKANFILNDVTYSVDPEGKSVWCEADIPADIKFDHFRLEYLSIVFAIDFFIKNISKQVKGAEQIKSTFKPGETSGHLYI
ncbi:MAG: hypothetical protein GY870_11985 [archaeon]|nr:hypothetical protein [archaeon]